ncbi:hypothetical protein E5288_WYG003910 [Bos mutus]|uniref:Uncharacterized protein n=1 Tax=Bos mutus TaxID=72004 RepID=A0A6B0S4J7_9CETA|nr:hypothetical protein [Bos mutus]
MTGTSGPLRLVNFADTTPTRNASPAQMNSLSSPLCFEDLKQALYFVNYRISSVLHDTIKLIKMYFYCFQGPIISCSDMNPSIHTFLTNANSDVFSKTHAGKHSSFQRPASPVRWWSENFLVTESSSEQRALSPSVPSADTEPHISSSTGQALISFDFEKRFLLLDCKSPGNAAEDVYFSPPKNAEWYIFSQRESRETKKQ